MASAYRYGPWGIEDRRRKRRNRRLALVLVPSVAVLLTAGGFVLFSGDDEYATLCVDDRGTAHTSDDLRVDDDDPRCPDALGRDGTPAYDGDDRGLSWVYVNTSSGYAPPAVGRPIGTHPAVMRAAKAPDGKVVVRAVPDAGLTKFPRGGFGGTAVKVGGGSTGS